MKPSFTTLTLISVLTASPVVAATEASAACDDRYQEVSQAWEQSKASRADGEEVTLSTTEGEDEVTSNDAQPTENWFGKPPSEEAVEEYLVAAETAMEEGDEAACLEQLKNVENAMKSEPEKAAED